MIISTERERIIVLRMHFFPCNVVAAAFAKEMKDPAKLKGNYRCQTRQDLRL